MLSGPFDLAGKVALVTGELTSGAVLGAHGGAA